MHQRKSNHSSNGELSILLTLATLGLVSLGIFVVNLGSKSRQDTRSLAQIQPTLTPIPTLSNAECFTGLSQGETLWECTVGGVYNCANLETRNRFNSVYCCGKDQWLFENANNYGRPGVCGGQVSEIRPAPPSSCKTSCNVYPTSTYISSPVPTTPGSLNPPSSTAQPISTLPTNFPTSIPSLPTPTLHPGGCIGGSEYCVEPAGFEKLPPDCQKKFLEACNPYGVGTKMKPDYSFIPGQFFPSYKCTSDVPLPEECAVLAGSPTERPTNSGLPTPNIKSPQSDQPRSDNSNQTCQTYDRQPIECAKHLLDGCVYQIGNCERCVLAQEEGFLCPGQLPTPSPLPSPTPTQVVDLNYDCSQHNNSFTDCINHHKSNRCVYQIGICKRCTTLHSYEDLICKEATPKITPTITSPTIIPSIQITDGELPQYCEPLPGEINGPQDDKLDVVFLSDGIPSKELFTEYSKLAILTFKLTNLGPDRLKKFNFWVYTNFNKTYNSHFEGIRLLWDTSKADEAKRDCHGDVSAILYNDPINYKATAITGGEQLAVTTGALKAFAHEMGHAVASLNDEYLYPGKPHSGKDEKPKINCSEIKSESPSHPCPKWKKDFPRVGCWQYCTYTDWFRPNYMSIMGQEIEILPFVSIPTSFNDPSLRGWDIALSKYN